MNKTKEKKINYIKNINTNNNYSYAFLNIKEVNKIV